jgi:HEAT repeat protein
LHTPDVAATINTINQVIAFCRQDQDIRHADGFLAGESFNGCPSLAEIERGLTHKNPAVVAAAQRMLATHQRGIATITPRIESEVSKRLPQLTNSNVQLRRDAALALGGIRGPGADSAIAELVHAVNNDEDRDVRLYALQSLGFIGDAAVASIVELLGSSDPMIRFQAISALNSVGDAANTPVVLAQIETALQDDDPNVRSNARRFLDDRSAKNQ